jgi:SAM-dependent methyltransferase
VTAPTTAPETALARHHKPLDPARHLFGPFRALHAAQLPGTSVLDLYEGDGARFYETFITPVVSDLAPFMRLARATGGPVLDLACGSGRLSVRLAQRGLDVTGVDLSADMLAAFTRRAAVETPDVRERLTLRRADISALDDVEGLHSARFGTVTLAATSLVLLGRPRQRAALFASVTRLLAPGGRFGFDLIDHDVASVLDTPDRYRVWQHSDDAHVTLVGEHVFCGSDGPRHQVNLLTEIVGSNGIERRIATTEKAVFNLAEIQGELELAGLRIQRARRGTRDSVIFLECAIESQRPAAATGPTSQRRSPERA